jgi:glycerol-1-phosphate dehydrogenase [NAD(P)+]
MNHEPSVPSGDRLFGATFPCICGRTHTIEPREIVYADDAVRQLPAVCRRAVESGGHPHAKRVGATAPALVLMDTRTRDVAGRAAAQALAADGWSVRELVVPDPAPGHSPVCDDVTKAALRPQLAGAAILVAVGSGVINDLGKWLAFEVGIPYACFATAVSMTGYASANVAPTVAGVKTLVDARPPFAVLADPRVLAAAPYEMTAAGLGDALAKNVSSADWYLNHRLFGDFYCPAAVGLVAEVEPLYLDHSERLLAGDAQAVSGLFRAMLLVGASMTMAGTSSPASGGEHVISHALDMMSALDGAEHDLHGRQVGVGTILAAAVYQRVLALDAPTWRVPADGVDRPFWGRLADGVSAAYAKKLPRLQKAAETLSRPGVWPELRSQLAAMVRPAAAMRQCLQQARAAVHAEDLGCDRARLLAAFTHAHQMRERFTILDLARLCGVLPEAYEEVLNEEL